MLKAGYCRKEITPEKPTPMAGFDLRKAAFSGIHDPLYVSALVLEQSGEVLVFCSFDLLGVTEEMGSLICDAVAKRLPIRKENIWVGATHTHAAPQSIFPSFACYDANYVRTMVSTAVFAVENAYQSRYQADIEYSHTTVSGVGSLRDQGRENAAYAMPCDSLFIKEQGGNRLTVLTVYACHPTVMNEQNLLVSRDLVYGFEKSIKERCPNAELILYNGACADVSTRYTRKEAGFAEAERLGALWADAVLSSRENARSVQGMLSARQERCFIPPAAFFTAAQRAEILPYLEQKIEDCTDAAQKREYIACHSVLQRVHYGKGKGCDALLGMYTVGEVLFCTLPFEYASGDAKRLKEKLMQQTGKSVVICCYSGGYEGYLPSGRALDRDSGYEDMASGYHHDAKNMVAKAFVTLAKGE